MPSAVKPGLPDLSSAVKSIPTAPIDISSDSDSSTNSVDSSDVEVDLATTAFIESITCNSRRERNSDGASPAKKPRLAALEFPKPTPPLDDSPVTAAVPLTMARVLPDSSCVTLKIGQNSNTNNNNNNNLIKDNQEGQVVKGCKQFWKAGDYEGDKENDSNLGFSSVGMDHARIHPKFLHSNATSHKWALGAFAELLDNSLDEVCNGATYVNIDMLKNKKDGSLMLMVEDNGGGMTPDKMRQCMSLGYSAKIKMANTIDGNGFKTSTMRLGADVIVFSRCQGINGTSPTQTIGLLSYTFLRATGKEDIVVPMIDYEKGGRGWNKMMRASPDDWTRNLETIVQWSPYSNEEDLLQQFNLFRGHGTRIVIYNLWEDDEGHLELDFDTDPHDIQIRGVNRDEKSIQMSKQYPNSRHFLTYRHSLRSYASILYLRLPSHFRIILRGQDIKHHNIVNDMMMKKDVTYKPSNLPEGIPKDSNMVAKVILGFVKDAHSHIDIQGFNVYHKNRLIKPFWRVWNAAGSDGRGVIGVLEANFVEPAHDKQGFERTNVLQRLEQRLVGIQKDFWSKNCHIVGYAPRRRTSDFPERDSAVSGKEKSPADQNGHGSGRLKTKSSKKLEKGSSPVNTSSEDGNFNEAVHSSIQPQQDHVSDVREAYIPLKIADTNGEHVMDHVTERSITLRRDSSVVERLEEALSDLSHERVRCKSLKTEIEKANERIRELEKEQEALIQVLVEEKTEREHEEEQLRKRLTKASNTIDELLEKVRLLEGRTTMTCKVEK